MLATLTLSIFSGAVSPLKVDATIFEGVLDGREQMLVVRLREDVWVAYDKSRGDLARIWKGSLRTTTDGLNKTLNAEALQGFDLRFSEPVGSTGVHSAFSGNRLALSAADIEIQNGKEIRVTWIAKSIEDDRVTYAKLSRSAEPLKLNSGSDRVTHRRYPNPTPLQIQDTLEISSLSENGVIFKRTLKSDRDDVELTSKLAGTSVSHQLKNLTALPGHPPVIKFGSPNRDEGNSQFVATWKGSFGFLAKFVPKKPN